MLTDNKLHTINTNLQECFVKGGEQLSCSVGLIPTIVSVTINIQAIRGAQKRGIEE